MLHIASSFENSLRRDILASPLPKRHTSCKGVAHGTGNYAAKPDKECDHAHSPFQRNDSKRWSRRSSINGRSNDGEDIEKSPFQRTSSARWSGRSKKSEKKPPSISSDNFSESDSLDSGEKTKSSDTTDDAQKKDNDVSNRLFKNVTKSSMAKTAKMRHLDIFDADENCWIGGLRKNIADDIGKSPKQEVDSPFSRSGSLRKSMSKENGAAKHSQENGFSKVKTGSIKKNDTEKAVNGFHRNDTGRNSFKGRRLNSKLSKIKCITYDEIVFMSNNKKTAGFFNVVDKNNRFKEFSELMEWKGEAVEVRYPIILRNFLINFIS